jgi:4-hydroxy-3-methylbut-2-en-1-yl diphosphate reductase
LVSKVHMEASRHHGDGLHVLLIGHSGHPEVEGTTGQLPPGAVTLIETVESARAYTPSEPNRLAYVTQTTLSVDDTAEIVAVLKERFPGITGPHKQDICYATTNRQTAVKTIANRVGLVIVVGAPNSSNSLRLVEVAERAGCPKAVLIQRASEIPWEALIGIEAVGVTAGASAPETLVDEVIEALRGRFDIGIETVTTADERIAFNVPRELREPAEA